MCKLMLLLSLFLQFCWQAHKKRHKYILHFVVCPSLRSFVRWFLNSLLAGCHLVAMARALLRAAAGYCCLSPGLPYFPTHQPLHFCAFAKSRAKQGRAKRNCIAFTGVYSTYQKKSRNVECLGTVLQATVTGVAMPHTKDSL